MQISKPTFLFGVALTLAVPGFGQSSNSQSLADVARQVRQQKQKDAQAQAKDDAAAGQPSKAPKVITNDEIENQAGPITEAAVTNNNSADKKPADATQSTPTAPKVPGETWKSQIQAQKQVVSTMQSNIDKEKDSIQFTPPNCVSGCVEWNQHQLQKQQDVERMQSQLATEKQKLQQMQDDARQQGYGSSVYDP